MDDKDRFIDELVDSALGQRQRTEPRAGFEGRILAHVRAAHESSRKKAWKLWLVAAATAAVVALVAIYAANRSQSPAPQTSQTANAVTAPPPREALKANAEPTPAASSATTVPEPKRIAHHERKPSRRVEAHRWPSQFPTPAPLTPEEKALVRYVQETPPQVLAASLFKKQFLDQPVKIKPLKITPAEMKPIPIEPIKEEMQ